METPKWIFKAQTEPQGSSNGFWYDMTRGGAIKVEELLVDPEQIEKVREATALLKSLEIALGDAGLLNEF